ncbi:MAG: DEAD/DEAH box helicase, partial [Candidatus Latescibacteria bacterium]|nr:DEAD/DEAH box helicase [Candidatus Latescibacterota bacterium]
MANSGAQDVHSFISFLEHTFLSDTIVHRQTIPPHPERRVIDASHLGPRVARIMEAAGIEGLWSHQEEGIRHLQEGRNVVVATPTSSGKTMVYNAAVLDDLMQHPSGCAIYIFPLKALEQDQLDELRTVLGNLSCGLTAEIYDGDTKPHLREKIRKHPPNILITTPDMLHSGLLAFHEAWEDVLKNLRWLVVDELHTYNGIFGSHVLHLFRRLNRLCGSYDSVPRFVTCSATIGNPQQLAERLFGQPFVAITDSGAPSATRHFLFVDPVDSPNTVASRLLQAGVMRQLRTIVFTRARTITELVFRWATQHRDDLRRKISSYRAGYLPEERRQIESQLISGDLLGVVTTSALELGIDIGGLDICVLVGYPGSIVNTWQRAGRVGRRGRESLVILLASRDALDQYFMKHPEQFFGRDIEDAVADPSNHYILEQHLPCAARELPLSLAESGYAEIPGYRDALDTLTERGELLQRADGDAWFASRKQPHRLVNMRAIGDSWSIVTRGKPESGGKRYTIGTVSGGQIYSECYEGAIYLHRGKQYLIGERNPVKRQIEATVVDVPYYTRPKREKETEILEELASKPMHGYQAKLGRLRVESQVIAFEKIRVGDGAKISRHPLESPVEVFETVGFWLEMGAPFKKHLKRRGYHHMGCLHATEHATKSLFPLLALSKGTDVGGICYPMHPQLRKG